MNTSPELIIVGDLSKDRTVIDGVSETGVGGGVYFAGFAARPAGIDLAVVTKVAAGDSNLLNELRKAGIRVAEAATPQTTTMTDIFESAAGFVRRSEVDAVASPFEPSEIPFKGPSLFYLTPMMRGIVSQPLIEELACRGDIALDIQGFLRQLDGRALEYRLWPEARQLLGLVRYLKTDRREAELLTGLVDRDRIISSILDDYGVVELLMTDDRGVIATDGDSFAEADFDEYDIRCRSGRGDTCFAAFLSRRLHNGIEASLAYAAEITNRKLKSPGPYRG
ncbi:MAG TPA: hypothetical protein VMW69_09800 [Spirochaetia bacterium]|nr:hypothetical protein [Spirochaetia bacterium]